MKKIILFFVLSSNLLNAQSNTFPATGNVGIGTTTPSEKLDVIGAIKSSGYSPTLILQRDTDIGGYIQGVQTRLKDGSNNWFFGNLHSDNWIVSKGDYQNPKFTILQSGNIGIGTNNPMAKLDINGDGHFKVADDRSGLGALTIETNNGTFLKLGGNTTYSWIQSHNSKPLYINELGNNTIFNLLGGNVGIGTTNPTGTLELQKLNSNLVFDLNTNGICRLISKGWNANIDMHTYQINGVENQNQLFLNTNGNVGIGTTNPTSKLTVAGNINSREVKVTVDAGADFVFDKGYDLPSLTSVEKFINENKHLPEIASASAMQKDGINLSEMNIKLLQKIEELTLYMIEQNKSIFELGKKLDNQNLEIKNIKSNCK